MNHSTQKQQEQEPRDHPRPFQKVQQKDLGPTDKQEFEGQK